MSKWEINIKKRTIVWILIGLIFIVWIFWPVNYSYFVFESEDGEKFNGDVYFDDAFIGTTNKGEIKVYPQEILPKEIIFEGTYNNERFEFFYDFPKDYLDYFELSFLVEEDDILEYIEENKEPEDNFSKVDYAHWGHLPITYEFKEPDSDRQSSVERQVNLTKMAFEKIEEETEGIVFFKEVNENPDISIYFKPIENSFNSNTHTFADALISQKDIEKNLIIKGEINFYGQGFACNTGYPALEVHEILHLFEIPHNPLTKSIMSPYTAESSSQCKITKIDDEYISCLRYIYSNGEISGNCDFPNIIHEKEEEYSCSEGWYPVEGTDYCCPEQGMEIDGRGYCSYP